MRAENEAMRAAKGRCSEMGKGKKEVENAMTWN